MSRQQGEAKVIKSLQRAISNLEGESFDSKSMQLLRLEAKRLNDIIEEGAAKAQRGGADTSNSQLFAWLSMTPERATRCREVLNCLYQRGPHQPISLYELAKTLGWPEEGGNDDYLTNSRRKLEAVKDVGLVIAEKEEHQWFYRISDKGMAVMDAGELSAL